MKRNSSIISLLGLLALVACQKEAFSTLPVVPEGYKVIRMKPERVAVKSQLDMTNDTIYAYLYGKHYHPIGEAIPQSSIENGYYSYVVPDSVERIDFSNICSGKDMTVLQKADSLVFVKKKAEVSFAPDILAGTYAVSGNSVSPFTANLNRLNARISATLKIKDSTNREQDINVFLQSASINLKGQAQSVQWSNLKASVSDEVLQKEEGTSPDFPALHEYKNLLPDAGFENEQVGTQPNEWNVLTIHNVSISDNAHSGHRSLQLRCGGNNGGTTARLSRKFKVEKNSFYRVVYWAKTQNIYIQAGDTTQFNIKTNCQPIYDVRTDHSMYDDWKQFYTDLYTGDNEELFFEMSLKSEDYSHVAMYIDDILCYQCNVSRVNLFPNPGLEENEEGNLHKWRVSNPFKIGLTNEKACEGKRSLQISLDAEGFMEEMEVKSPIFKYEKEKSYILFFDSFNFFDGYEIGLHFDVNSVPLRSYRKWPTWKRDEWKHHIVSLSNLCWEYSYGKNPQALANIKFTQFVRSEKKDTCYLDNFRLYEITSPDVEVAPYEELIETKQMTTRTLTEPLYSLPVVEDLCIMPTARGKENIMELVLVNKAGEKTILKKKLDYSFEMNKHYRLELVLKMNEGSGHFMIEDVKNENINIDLN